ncbi:MAG: hypothetical protein ACOC8F_04060 [Planctomycetota bacterium]
MKRRVFVAAIVACVLTATGATAPAADRKKLADVRIDALINESQKSAGPTDGMNLVWYIPFEFWQVSFVQDDGVNEQAAAEMSEVLEPYFMLAVVRANISPFGAFTFHSREAVARTTTTVYTDHEGDEHALKPMDELPDDLQTLLAAVRPILANALGPAGQNLHIYVFSATDERGRKLVSPYHKGELTVTLAETPNETGGVVPFELPADSLHVPRRCCGKDMHISWKYCPFCGKRLPE